MCRYLDNPKEDPETFQSYIPELNIKRRFAQTALVAKSDTDPELALKQIYETNVVKNNDETLSCNICGKVTKGIQKKFCMQQHMETHVEGLSLMNEY